MALGDIAEQRQQLAVLVNLDAAVVSGRTAEPADGGMLNGADGSDLRRRFQMLRAGELHQGGDRLIKQHHGSVGGPGFEVGDFEDPGPHRL
jgi:hypothetical protein